MGFRGSVCWAGADCLAFVDARVVLVCFWERVRWEFRVTGSRWRLNACGGGGLCAGDFPGAGCDELDFAILGASLGLVVGNLNFVKKVVFPLEVLPVALAGQLGFNFLVNFSLCLLGLVT